MQQFAQENIRWKAGIHPYVTSGDSSATQVQNPDANSVRLAGQQRRPSKSASEAACKRARSTLFYMNFRTFLFPLTRISFPPPLHPQSLFLLYPLLTLLFSSFALSISFAPLCVHLHSPALLRSIVRSEPSIEPSGVSSGIINESGPYNVRSLSLPLDPCCDIPANVPITGEQITRPPPQTLLTR